MTPDNWPPDWPQVPYLWKPRRNSDGDVIVSAVAMPTAPNGAANRYFCGMISTTSEPDTWRWSDGNRWHYVVGPPTVAGVFDAYDWEYRYSDTVVRIRAAEPEEILGER